MASVADIPFASAAGDARRTTRAHPLRRLVARPAAAVGLVVVVVFITIAVFAPLIAPYDPIATNFGAVRKAPSAAHWFGTDEIGRDVL